MLENNSREPARLHGRVAARGDRSMTRRDTAVIVTSPPTHTATRGSLYKSAQGRVCGTVADHARACHSTFSTLGARRTHVATVPTVRVPNPWVDLRWSFRRLALVTPSPYSLDRRACSSRDLCECVGYQIRATPFVPILTIARSQTMGSRALHGEARAPRAPHDR